MKNYWRYLIFLLTIVSILTLEGCGDKTLPQNDATRDDYNIGGDLTFYYDDVTQTAVFGKEGETIEFYSQDLTRGWKNEGNRVGLKIIAPVEVNDFESGWAKVGDEKIDNGGFFQIVNGQKTRQANFYPIVKEDDNSTDIEICWQEGSKTQIYHVKVVENTKFSNGEDNN